MTATKQLIRVGHSPDPDDAFMYWAIADGRVDTRGHDFEPVVADIETLKGQLADGTLTVCRFLGDRAC